METLIVLLNWKWAAGKQSVKVSLYIGSFDNTSANARKVIGTGASEWINKNVTKSSNSKIDNVYANRIGARFDVKYSVHILYQWHFYVCRARRTCLLENKTTIHVFVSLPTLSINFVGENIRASNPPNQNKRKSTHNPIKCNVSEWMASGCESIFLLEIMWKESMI